VRGYLEAATHALKIKPGEIMGELLTPTHMIVVAVVAFVLFGGKKLPELGKGLGEGLRGFKDGIKGLTDELDGSKVAPAVVGKAEAAE
jgi:sec-independent protein translocase protein TatA